MPPLGGRAQLRLGRALPPLGRGCERLPETLAGLHFIAFAGLTLKHAAVITGP